VVVVVVVVFPVVIVPVVVMPVVVVATVAECENFRDLHFRPFIPSPGTFFFPRRREIGPVSGDARRCLYEIRCFVTPH
jgi:hypothetical protein